MRAEQWEREDARVTVVIPNYNGMKYLPQCIAALRRQTERDFSLLVMETVRRTGARNGSGKRAFRPYSARKIWALRAA